MLIGVSGVKYMPSQWCVLIPGAKDMSKVVDNINYACTWSDCTAIGCSSSCNNLDANGNASYAFNMYYHIKNQDDLACGYQGLGEVTTQNLSQG
ncbi:hypothetical protein WN943_026066 [Citrus x changshan-huyou]